jgi:hypothetical protein
MLPKKLDLTSMAIGVAIGGIGDHLIGQIHWLVTGRAMLWALESNQGELGDLILDYIGDLFRRRGR